MVMKTYVYSGDCRQCEIGLPTNHKDLRGTALVTGDIVQVYTRDKFFEGEGIYAPRLENGLTVVTADQFKTYGDGTHELNTGSLEYYVMGIKSVDLADPDGDWLVLKVKDHADVVDGEHWTNFGFNYRREPAHAEAA